jgi:hypothetical protein
MLLKSIYFFIKIHTLTCQLAIPIFTISVTKSVTKPGEFGGILGHFRACWGHENTMMSVLYRLARPFRNQQARGSTPLFGSSDFKGLRVSATLILWSAAGMKHSS